MKFGTLFSRLLCLLTITGAVTAAEKASPAPGLPFNPRAGETVVFLGDSITHQALYPQYLENYFITRHPDRPLRFRNAGVAGDSVADALARFDADVAAHRPAYVTVHLGMNDGRYEPFKPENITPYRTGLARLIARIKSIGATPVLLSPTMFDHHVTVLRADDAEWRFRSKEFSPDYNALLGYFTGLGIQTAAHEQIPFVDWWSPLNRLTREQRTANPDFTMIWDAIHPQASGQVVMVSEILLQLGAERRAVGGVSLVRGDRRWSRSKGVTDFVVDDRTGEIRFSHRANSLPWVVPVEHATHPLRWKLPADGRLGFKLAKAGHRLGAERVKVAGLAPGRYEIEIDGQAIGQWSQVALGTRVEIQENEKAPQFRQALQVAHLNRRRTDEFVRPARELAGRIKGLRRRDAEANRKRIVELIGQIRELEAKSDALLTEIYAAAQPPERRWVIRQAER